MVAPSFIAKTQASAQKQRIGKKKHALATLIRLAIRVAMVNDYLMSWWQGCLDVWRSPRPSTRTTWAPRADERAARCSNLRRGDPRDQQQKHYSRRKNRIWTTQVWTTMTALWSRRPSPPSQQTWTTKTCLMHSRKVCFDFVVHLASATSSNLIWLRAVENFPSLSLEKICAHKLRLKNWN